METEADHAEEQIRSLFGQVEQAMDALVAEHTEQYRHLRSIMPAVVRNSRPDPYEFALPLLVYGAENGDPAGAVPIAAVHALWWRAANVIDDLSDDAASDAEPPIGRSATMMAAFNWAYVVPARVVERLPVPEQVRRTLTSEFLQACTAATEGQLADVFTDPGDATHAQVLRTYQNKSSAPYVMASAMAARTAGADDVRTERWRSFGHNLGLLGQFRNDQDDLQSGRMQDLANRTPTLHLVSLLNSAAGADRERILALLDRAHDEPAARDELLQLMLDRELVRSYLSRIDRIRDEAGRILDDLGGVAPFTAALREWVRAAATPCALLAEAAGGTRPPTETTHQALLP